MDVYKPHRAKSQSLTVKSSSYRSKRSYYQLPNWFSGADPRELMCLGRWSCKQLADLGKLTLGRLAKWTQLNVDYLKEVVKVDKDDLASSLVRLACVLLDQELSRRVEAVMSQNQVAELERCFKGILLRRDFDYSDRRLEIS